MSESGNTGATPPQQPPSQGEPPQPGPPPQVHSEPPAEPPGGAPTEQFRPVSDQPGGYGSSPGYGPGAGQPQGYGAAPQDSGSHPTQHYGPPAGQSGYGPPAGGGYGNPQPDQPTTAFGAPPGSSYGPPGGGAPYGSPSPYGGQPAYQPTQQPSPQPSPQYGAGAGYPPAEYGSAYGTPYGAGQYGQQPAYGAAPAGYGPATGAYATEYPQQPPAKKSRKGIWISLVALVVVIGILVLVSVIAKVPASLYPKNLSHSSVEKFIEGNSQLGSPANVTCNGGKDYRLKNNGDTFSCRSADGRDFKVTITDKNDGHYTVQ